MLRKIKCMNRATYELKEKPTTYLQGNHETNDWREEKVISERVEQEKSRNC